jgi:RNA polymerase sigma factor (TIGR02999 family)
MVRVGPLIQVTTPAEFEVSALWDDAKQKPVAGVPVTCMLGGMADVTQILAAIEQGDPTAAAELLPLVYDELRKLAAAHLAHEKPGQTLQPTALVHEAYLRLVAGGQPDGWGGRGHFFAAAAEAMRRILVEAARRKNADKAGGTWQRHDLLDAELAVDSTGDDLFAVDEALTRLTTAHPRAARLVHLRFFLGMTLDEAAAHLGLDPRTAYRDWAYARAWLRRELDRG